MKQNGFLFGQLLQKSGNIKTELSKYNNDPKNISEIKENFKSLKKDLKLMGIYVNDEIINDIISEKEGIAAKLIYKIKIENNRMKIDFDKIIGKINENSYREKQSLGKSKSNFNKNNVFETIKNNKLTMSPIMSTTSTAFRNFFLNPKYKSHKNILLSQENKLNLDKSINKIIKSKSKIKLKPIILNDEIKEKEVKSFKTTLDPDFTSNIESYKINNDLILEKINEEDEKNVDNNKHFISGSNINKKYKEK